jgi:hypothetical protein
MRASWIATAPSQRFAAVSVLNFFSTAATARCFAAFAAVAAWCFVSINAPAWARSESAPAEFPASARVAAAALPPLPAPESALSRSPSLSLPQKMESR